MELSAYNYYRNSKNISVQNNQLIEYSVIKFDRKYYNMQIYSSTKSSVHTPNQQISGIENYPNLIKSEENGKIVARSIDYTLSGIAKSHQQSDNFAAIWPVGWGVQLGVPEWLGLSRVNGESPVGELFSSSGMTALFCLDNKVIKMSSPSFGKIKEQISSVFNYNPPRFNYTFDKDRNNVENFDKLMLCNDFIQTGPRVIEYKPSSSMDGIGKIGIKDEVTNRNYFNWIIFLVDADRKYYIITFTKPVSLFHVALLLSSDEFYGQLCDTKMPGALSCEHWAVALTGAQYAGIIINENNSEDSKNFISIGNTSSIIPGYIVLSKSK